jgi:hypothetical protein
MQYIQRDRERERERKREEKKGEKKEGGEKREKILLKFIMK